MQEFFTAISNFGFPIVLTGYLLIRYEGKIEKLAGTISKFSEILEGKPSEKKVGLIEVMEKNNKETKNLAGKVEKLSRKIK
jgi:hypothetical protein